MSDPSIIGLAREAYRKSTSIERDWWNSAPQAAKESILNEADWSDLGASYYKTATEAYQKDYLATSYDTLPQTIKDTIHESLIAQGELPNPSIYRGIGQAYEVGKDILVECDRCDEAFTTEADFESHKAIDHGDEPEDFNKVEETFTLSMNPDVSRESLRQARQLLAEAEQKTLGKLYFNGKDIPSSKLTVPKAKAIQGYNDNPNAGLSEYPEFVFGNASDRLDGSVTESYAEELGGGDWYQVRGGPQFFNYVKVKDMGGETIFQCVACKKEVSTAGGGAPVMTQHLKSHGLAVEGYEDDAMDAKYDQSQSLSDISEVPERKEKQEDLGALEGIDFSEEAIDFVYPTKAGESVSEEKNKMTSLSSVIDRINKEYGGSMDESDDEVVENQIIDRKLRGYGAEAIANELAILYDVSREDALEKVYSIEVSVNDKVANTFFGKRYRDCNEAEIRELKMYSGSDENE